MTHREFAQLIGARKALICEVLRAALPRGAGFAVFTTLGKSDDASEETLAVMVTNLNNTDVLALVERYAKGQRNGSKPREIP